MDSNEILKVLTEELVERVLNKMKSREEADDKVDDEAADDKSLKDGYIDWEDEIEDWENKVKDLEDTSDVMSQRNNCRYSKSKCPKRKIAPQRKSGYSKRIDYRMNKHDVLETIKDNIKEDRANLFKLLNSDLRRDIEELRWFCVDTDIYRNRFDSKNSWFIDGIDDTMDNLEKSGRDYVELVDSLISYIDDLITKIDNGEI